MTIQLVISFSVWSQEGYMNLFLTLAVAAAGSRAS